MSELVDIDGTHTVQLSDKDGLVVMHFEKPVKWVALDPTTAGNLAEAMARGAYKARFGDTPTTEKKSQITEQVRARLGKRVELMLRSMAAEVPAVDYSVQAKRVVDAMLKEAT